MQYRRSVLSWSALRRLDSTITNLAKRSQRLHDADPASSSVQGNRIGTRGVYFRVPSHGANDERPFVEQLMGGQGHERIQAQHRRSGPGNRVSVNLRAAQHLLGHQDIRMTLR